MSTARLAPDAIEHVLCLAVKRRRYLWFCSHARTSSLVAAEFGSGSRRLAAPHWQTSPKCDHTDHDPRWTLDADVHHHRRMCDRYLPKSPDSLRCAPTCCREIPLRTQIFAICFCAAILVLFGIDAHAQNRGITLILVPGAGGATPNDFLIRNGGAFAARGFQTTVAMSASDIISSAKSIRSGGRKAVLVSMSKGTLTAAEAISQGASVAGVVFVSGFMMPGTAGSVPSILGGASKLPITLVVHHRGDRCPLTPPEGATAFVDWSAGKATMHWVEGGESGGAPCRPMSAHGYFGQDIAAVSAITSFASVR